MLKSIENLDRKKKRLISIVLKSFGMVFLTYLLKFGPIWADEIDNTQANILPGQSKSVENVLTLNPNEYGAKCDGIHDDTDAFNAVSMVLRRNSVNIDGSTYATKKIQLPSGVCVISSWNLTGLLIKNLIIEGSGTTIIGNKTNVSILDLLGSRYMALQNFYIVGKSDRRPSNGIQVGPIDRETNGNISFLNMHIEGYFEKAACLNVGSEQNQWFSSVCQNKSASPAAYAFIGDGSGETSADSLYAKPHSKNKEPVSFTGNVFHGMQFRNEGGGVAIKLSNTWYWSFDSGSYFLSFGKAAIELYGTAQSRNELLTIEGLIESAVKVSNLPGLIDGIILTGNGSPTSIDGLRVRSFEPHCSRYLFHKDKTSGLIKLNDADIYVTKLKVPGAKLFGSDGGLIFNGRISATDTSINNSEVLEMPKSPSS